MSSYLGLPVQSSRARSGIIRGEELDEAYATLAKEGPLLVAIVPEPDEEQGRFGRLLQLLEEQGRARSRMIAGKLLPPGRHALDREFRAVILKTVEEAKAEEVPGDAGAQLVENPKGTPGRRVVSTKDGLDKWSPAAGPTPNTPRSYL